MNRLIPTFFLMLPAATANGAEPVELSEDTFRPGGAVITMGLNWGRMWKCGAYENAQIHALTFRKLPLTDEDGVSIELETPSKLLVDNKFLPYAFVVEPGEYVLTAFDVKVARSVSDVGHLKGTEADLIKDGKPLGGSFTANHGEVAYLGHFGLDCAAEPFLWRYYLQNREEFESWVSQFREKYPYAKALAPKFRLFETTTLGMPFSLEKAEK